jgi:hypothetical protein
MPDPTGSRSLTHSTYPPWPALLAALRGRPHDYQVVLAVLDDCEPEDGTSMFVDGCRWVQVVAGYDEDERPPAVLAPELFDRVSIAGGDDPQSSARHYASASAAYRALAEACDAYASGPREK